ncbi:hypothetical protein SAMN05428950_1011277 [Sphingomonas sp. OV641]|uniref:hypothetical protein n=1 Tax=unclassified Sphingomonas TaxID=196159 RepID=UPI0008AC82C4|nr:hypothetical protein SAMN05428950_1011277 [Sphingomonas sp. OV641]
MRADRSALVIHLARRARRTLALAIRPSAGAGRAALLAAPALFLSACAKQMPSAVTHTAATPGFLLGLWHGFIFPVAWMLSLFMPDVAVYAVPNNGGWYDFGYFIGIVFLGVGARKTRTVYVTRRARP